MTLFDDMSVHNPDEGIPAYFMNSIQVATTTDLSSLFSAPDLVYVGADIFEVTIVEHYYLELIGKLTTEVNDHIPIYIDGVGVEHLVIMTAFNADLSTFHVVPTTYWRGIESKIFISRPNGTIFIQFTLSYRHEMLISTLTMRQPVRMPLEI